MTVDFTDFIDVLEADVGRMAAAARVAGLDAPVAACPGWTVRDLVDHVAVLHRWVEETVRTRAQERIDRAPMAEAQAAVPDPIGAFEEGAAALVATFRAVAPDEPVYNWTINMPKVAAFWPRRMAHETAVHRWDAQAAAGLVEPVGPPAFAVDGIDEWVDVFLPNRLAGEPGAGWDGSVHLHCTDGDGEWLVSVADGVADVRREHAKGDAAVRGPASDLLLFLWNRLGDSEVEVFGDAAVLAGRRRFVI